MNKLGTLFNDYASAFSARTEGTAFDVDFTLTVRIRLFGTDKRKNEAWEKEHGFKGPIYFTTISTDPPQIYGDLRQVKAGTHRAALVVNHLSLGHEILHALRVAMAEHKLKDEDDGLLMSPDKYADI